MSKYNVETFFVLLLFGMSLVYAARSIIEFIDRDEYHSCLNEKIIEKENNLQSLPDSIKQSALNTIKYLKSQRDNLNQLKKNGGGYSNLTVGKIRYLTENYNCIEDSPADLKDYNETLSSIYFLWFYLWWSNTILLFFSTIVCGALGAIISSLLNRIDLKIVSILIGISAAFITFIALQGGNQIFIETSVDARLNPFTVSFIAILSGIYSKKVFKFFNEKYKFLDPNA